MDLIDRQAAIDAFKKELTVGESKGNYVTICSAVGYEGAKQILESLPSAEPELHWIPVTERLPKKHGETYFVTISDGAVYSAALQWDANRKRWYLSFLDDGNILVDFIDEVIAWMPLPEPYKGEQDG